MTIREAKKQWARRRRKYAVGYVASGNLLFCARWGLEAEGNASLVPMSLAEAKKFLAKMPSSGAVIFEVAPIAVLEPTETGESNRAKRAGAR